MAPLRPALPLAQGKAYEGLREGTYYPAISLYTDRRQQQATAAVTANFGDSPFAFPPPTLEGCPPPRPICELPGPWPQPAQQEGAAAGAAQLQPQQPAAQQQQATAAAQEQQAALPGGGQAEVAPDAAAATAVQTG